MGRLCDEYVVNGEIGQHKEGLTDEVAICDEYVVDGAIGKRKWRGICSIIRGSTCINRTRIKRINGSNPSEC